MDARVTLDLPSPDGIYPLNALPAEPHAVVRGTVQVTQEDQHMDVLAPYLSGAERSIAVTLHTVEEARSRSTVEVVEVRLDGRRIGVLSSTETANLLPLVKHIEARGKVAVARAALKGNALKADATLAVIRAQDADPAWLRSI